jgi:sigma-E factor negative regulatory protein RseB
MKFFIFFCLVSSNIFANEQVLNAQQWLEKMSHSMKSLDYQGTIAFFKNGRLDTMRYYHTADQGLEKERLLSLNSPMREVVREAGKVSCVFKESKKIVVNHRPVSQSFIADIPSDFNIAKAIYDFALEGTESVAMQVSQMVSISPKDKMRYARKFWIDTKNFLPLKVEVYDLFGTTVEQVVFTDLKVELKTGFISVEDLKKSTKIEHINKLQLSSLDQADFILGKIPAGFKTVFFTQRNQELSPHTADHLLISDGFSTVSVYTEEKTDDAQEGLQTLGSVNSFTRIVGNIQITAMGEVPAATVLSIAESITFR